MKRSMLLLLFAILFGLSAFGEKKQNDTAPAWSPDGTRIAFVSAQEGKKPQVYVIDADGANVRQVTHQQNGADSPDWSPDGKKLVISVCTKSNTGASWWDSRRGGKVTSMGLYPPEWDIYIMDADGSNPLQLTHDRGDAAQPAWSPDGKKIAFTSAQEGPYHIYVMDSDGSNRQQVAKGENPAWSPDGKKIAFVELVATNIVQMYTVNLDGSGLLQLTSREMKVANPGWARMGRELRLRCMRKKASKSMSWMRTAPIYNNSPIMTAPLSCLPGLPMGIASRITRRGVTAFFTFT